MSLGLPDFGDIDTPPFNPLIYPRRVLIEVLEDVFSQTNLTVYPGAPTNPFLYIAEGHEPNLRSKLVIADTFSDELKKKDPRPTVVLGRGTFQFSDMAIDSKRDYFANKLLTRVSSTPASGTDTRTQSKYSDMTTVGIDIQCFSRRDTEAEQLAWIVSGILRFFRNQIRDGSRIHKMSSPVIGKASQVKSDAQIDLFVVPINLIVHQPLVWQVQTTASLTDIATGLTNRSGYPYPKSWSDSSPVNIDLNT